MQTPFTLSGGIDELSLLRLVEDVLRAGAAGLLVPAVASESAALSPAERVQVARLVQAGAGDLPVFWGAGTHELAEIAQLGAAAQAAGAAALLVAVPPALYLAQARIPAYFAQVARSVSISLMVQDLDFSGPGMTTETIAALCAAVPSVRYLKIETVPAGPKYSAVLAATAGNIHVSGGWAVPQLIEALDRGVDAMIPESSMVRIYTKIVADYRRGARNVARARFWQLLPVLAFANQTLATSIAFFKRLLVRKGIFTTAVCRMEGTELDRHQLRIADELIELVLALEAELHSDPSPPPTTAAIDGGHTCNSQSEA